MSRYFIAFLMALFTTACGQEKPYQVNNLRLTQQTAPFFIGQNKQLALQIIDNRSDAVVGYHRFGLESESPVIVPDTAPILLKTLSEQLRSAGFVPMPAGTIGATSLELRVIDIAYENKGNVITGNEKTVVRAELVAKNGLTTMTRMLEARSLDSDFMRPSASHQLSNIDKGVSAGLDKIIAKIMTDRSLLTFLQQ